MRTTLLLVLATMVLVGCRQEPTDLSQVGAQPPADFERGRQATTIEEWAAANPNNHLPGHGEGGAGMPTQEDK